MLSEEALPAPATNGCPSTLIKDYLAGGASRLAALSPSHTPGTLGRDTSWRTSTQSAPSGTDDEGADPRESQPPRRAHVLEHPAVLESAVVGKSEEQRGAIVKALVVLREGHQRSDDLREELRILVRNRVGAHAYPCEIDFVDALPKTPSGKIQRFLLREES